MIKGIKHSDIILDNRIIDFMANIGVTHHIDRRSSPYYFEFQYYENWMVFETTISFENFIKEFVGAFYKKGYLKCADIVSKSISTLLWNSEVDAEEQLKNLL